MRKPMYGTEEEQTARAQHMLRLFTEYRLHDFDESGHYIGPDHVTGMRERLFMAYSFLAEGSAEAVCTGNRIIESSEYYPCHFAPKTAIQILTKYDDRLTEGARCILSDYLHNVIEHSASDEMDFVGVNDNFPCMSTFIALIGGRLLNRPDLAEIGVKRLHQLKALLTRRGFASEFNSPTYTGVQLVALAELANDLEEGELKEIALDCEGRIWADQLAHLHPSTFQVAGPYSRAYTVDSTGHTHHSRYALYALLGDRLRVNPLNTVFSSATAGKGEVIHHSPSFMQMSAADALNTVYHCPAELVEHAFSKSYPYEVTGTFEVSSSTDANADKDPVDPAIMEDMTEYPAGVGTAATYMTEDYALGTCTREFHNGNQTDSFHLLWRRDPRGEAGQANIRTMYARYLVNEKKPGQHNYYPAIDYDSAESFLLDEGRKLAVQHKGTAMVLYKPKRYVRTGVNSLKLSVIIPCQYGDPDEIWLGERRLEALEGESVEPCPVYVKDGAVYVAFHPLLLTDHGRSCAVRVERAYDYLLISFYNYEGEERDFDPKTFLLTGNGFAAQVSSEAEAGSFSAFRTAAEKAFVQDAVFFSSHSRRTVLRRTSFETAEGVKLRIEYSPVSEGIKYMEVNGEILGNERLVMTGYDVSQLPFMK